MDQLKKFLLYTENKNNAENLQMLDTANANFKTAEELIIDIPTTSTSLIIGQDVLTDVEMIKSFNGSETNTVYSSLNFLSLKGSHTYFKHLLSSPIVNVDILNKRQSQVQNASANIQKADELFKIMSETEADMLSMYEPDKDEMTQLFDLVYFKFVLLKPLNNDARALTALNLYKIVASPLIGILSPIVYFIIPFIILRVKLKVKFSFIEYLKTMMNAALGGTPSFLGTTRLSYLSFALSLIFYFQNLFNNVEVAKVVYSISKHISNKMNNVISFINAAESLLKGVEVDHHAFYPNSLAPKPLGEFSSTSSCMFNICSNFGQHLEAFRHFKKDHYKTLLQHVYKLDSLFNIARIQTQKQFCFPSYIDNEKENTKLNINQLWHPCLENPVKNDMTIEKSIILTGPNAGGKSTLIKAALISILLSQTISISNAESISFTPLSYIGSQMNIPDCKGKESLFEAEMYRSKHNIDVLKNLKANERSILFMDEIFSSTNPVEGIAGAYAIAKNMATYKQNVSIITTHYLYLAKLAQKHPDEWVNLRMNAIITYEIEYPYILTRGISRQCIAIEILKKNGFDACIVDEALALKNKLLNATGTNHKSNNIGESNNIRESNLQASNTQESNQQPSSILYNSTNTPTISSTEPVAE